MPTFEFISRCETETDRLAAKVAQVIEPGDVVALVGTLGAGKTRFVQGLARALGHSPDSITSPTFVLINEYPLEQLPLFHMDVYRLKDDDEFLGLGPDEYFDGIGVTLIEWGDQVRHLLPERTSQITIELTGGEERQFVVDGDLAERLLRTDAPKKEA